jgi:hypothetical protein
MGQPVPPQLGSGRLREDGRRHLAVALTRTDPSKHAALYEFSSLEEANAAIQSPGKEFDATWGERAKRTRDVVEVVQQLPISN